MAEPPPNEPQFRDNSWRQESPQQGPSPLPPEAWPRLVCWRQQIRRPMARFLRIEAASGVVLMVAAIVALIWTCSPWRASYHQLWQQPLGLQMGPWQFARPLRWWLNDGLMTLVFLVVGLELRREIHGGVLARLQQALLPVAAALGGMLAPALLYLMLAGAPATRSGWGVPTATDIAFAIGVLTLLGPRVPTALRVLLLALAVIDDLGAVLIISLCYSGELRWSGLALAVGGGLGILLLQRLGLRHRWPYALPAVLVWAGLAVAGVHPSLAGVVIGLLTPVRAWWGADGLRADLQAQLMAWVDDGDQALPMRLRRLQQAGRESRAPADHLLEALHPWVAFVVLPIYALANAGVDLGAAASTPSAWRVGAGVTLALLLGKPLGVVLAAGLCLRARWAVLPEGLGARHLLILGVVAGVGFTMALFVAQLAFADPVLLTAAKLGVLAASIGAALATVLLGHVLMPAAGPDRQANASRRPD